MFLRVHAGKPDASSNHQPPKLFGISRFDSIYEAPLGRISIEKKEMFP
jgi:hypothetical protein